MKPSQLLATLVAAFSSPDPRPILIHSEPGIGKSDVTAQAIASLNFDSVLSHPAVEDPTDAKGIPWGGKDGIEFFPIGQIKRVLAATRRTVWVLEDFGQANPSVQAAYMQWLLARECSGFRLPDCVSIVVLTNGRGHRANVSGILETVKSRCASLLELTADIQDFCEWAIRSGRFDHCVDLIAFLRFRSELLSAFNPSADLTNSPSPRTWNNAAWVLSLDLPKALRNEALAGAVGSAAATEYLAFRDMYRSLPSIDGIFIDPDSATIPTEPSVLYATATAVGARATEMAFPRVARYAERLESAGYGDMAGLIFTDVRRRFPSVEHTPEWVRMITGPIGSLIHGSN